MYGYEGKDKKRGARRSTTAAKAAARYRIHLRLRSYIPAWARVPRGGPREKEAGYWRENHPCACGCRKRAPGRPKRGYGVCYADAGRPAWRERQGGHRLMARAARELAGWGAAFEEGWWEITRGR